MRRQGGFTVIEVTMFLAISGTMAIALLAGIGVAIQRQQYRDAVQSYANFLTEQYSKVISIENDRQPTDPCPIPGASVNGYRGQSNCVIVGRYIIGEDQGRSFRVKLIYALLGADGKTWSYRSSNNNVAEYQTNWSVKTALVEPSGGGLSVAMVRNPATGELAIRSDSRTYPDDKINELLTSSGDATYEVCIYDEKWFSPERLSVFIGARAGSREALTVKGAGNACKAL